MLGRFSLRQLLFVVAVVAFIVTAYETYGSIGTLFAIAISGGISALVHYLGVIRLSNDLYRFLFWLGFVCGHLCFAMWLLLGCGPHYSRSSWPRPLKEMVEVCDGQQVQLYGWGHFIGSEYVWRMEIERQAVDGLKNLFMLNGVEPTDVPAAFWKMFPRLWRPSPSSKLQYFASASFPTHGSGQEGVEYLYVAFDAKAQQMYVWFKLDL